MLPLALTAALAVSGPDLIDWAKATDDMRFALLKPVMAEKEVRRLFAGKEQRTQACGFSMTADGKGRNYSGAGYRYKLTGRDEVVGMTFDFLGPVWGEEPKPAPEELPPYGQWGPGGWAQPKAKVIPGELVGFSTEGVRYKRTKEGLFEAQPAKK